MDVNALFSVLVATLDGDNRVRRAAEESLTAARKVPGFLHSLLRIVTQDGVPPEVSMQAAIQFKNSVSDSWVHHEEGDRVWSDEEKAAVREIVIEAAMLTKLTPVLVAIAQPIAIIAVNDFPDFWPALVPSLLSNLSSGNPQRIHNVIYVIRYVCHKFQFKSNEGRIPFDMIIDAVFPPLFQMLKVAMSMNTAESANVLKVILKSFWSGMQYMLGNSLNKPDILTQWVEQLNILVNKHLPLPGEAGEPAGQPVDPEDRPHWVWWKIKKWTMQIINRLFYRFGIPKYVAPEQQELAKFISSRLIVNVMPGVMQQLAYYAGGGYLEPRVALLNINFVGHCLEPAVTYKLLKPHLSDIIWKVILPVLSFHPEDHKRWVDEPEDFVRFLYDPMASLVDPRTGATTFLIDLLKHRKKDTLGVFWEHILAALGEYERQTPETKNPAQQDGLLYMFGAAYDVLINSKKHKKQLEAVIAKFVIPEFSSPAPFLRLRACWAFSQFADMEFVNPDNFKAGVAGILKCMEDAELPVKFTAGSAFRYCLDNNLCHDMLAPILPSLLEKFFVLLGELGIDDIVTTLDRLIDRFSAELTSVAIPIIAKLSETFMTYVSTGDDEDDEVALASSGCLGAICTVLKGLKGRPDIFAQLEPVVCPLIEMLLREQGDMLEWFEDAVSLLSYFALNATPITPRLWHNFIMLMTAFHKYAYDYVTEIMLPIAAFMSRGSDVFVSGVPEQGINFLEIAWKANAKIEGSGSEHEMVTGLAIFWAALHYLGGRIDSFAMNVLTHMLNRLRDAKLPEYRETLIATIFKCVIYNPLLSIGTMEGLGALAPFIAVVGEEIKHFKSFTHMETCAFAISLVLRQPLASLPASVTTQVPTLVKYELKFLEGTAADDGESEGGSDNDEDEGGADAGADAGAESDDGPGEHEDADNDEDEAYLAALGAMGKKIERQKKAMEAAYAGDATHDDDGDDGDSTDDDAMFDAEFYGRQFDLPSYNASAFVHFYDTMSGLSAAYPQLVSQLNDVLDEETRTTLRDALESGQNYKAEGGEGELKVEPLEA